jgi:hypothetical protein
MRDRSRISRLFYFEGLAFGFFSLSVVVFAVEVLRAVQGNIDLTQSPWLIILPIAASTYLSFRAMAEQSRLQLDLEDERFDREKRLAQAEMAVPISDMLESCGKMIQYHFHPGAQQVNWIAFDKSLEALKPAIRSSTNEVAERLLLIVRTYQVLRARMKTFDENKRDRSLKEPDSWANYEVVSSSINWATLHALLEQALSYARRPEEKSKFGPLNGRVRSAYFINDVMIENYPTLSAALNRRDETSYEMDFSETV